MAYLSTRHDGRDHQALSEEHIHVENGSECDVQNHGFCRISSVPQACLGLRKLDMSFNMFETLDGIEQFSQLRHLLCYSCRLRSVEGLQEVKKLETLYLNQNRMESIPSFFATFKKLTHLRLDHNEIRKFGSSLTGCSPLRRLDVSSNRLQSVKGLHGLQNLTELRISNNAITSLKDLRALPSLIELDVSHNLLETLEGIQHLPTLQTINCMHNRLSSLEVPISNHSLAIREGQSALVDINASSNRLTSLRGLGSMSQLVRIDVCGNKLNVSKIMTEESDEDRKILTGLAMLEELLLSGGVSGIQKEDDGNTYLDNLRAFFRGLRMKCKHMLSIDGHAFSCHSGEGEEGDSSQPRTLITTLPNTDSHDAVDSKGEDEDKEASVDSDEEIQDSKKPKRLGKGAESLTAKVVMEVKTMAELEVMETSIRDVLSSTRDILNSVFLLEETTDGLFSSLPSEQLPKSTQFAAIAAASRETHWTPSVPKNRDGDELYGASDASEHHGGESEVAKIRTGVLVQDHMIHEGKHEGPRLQINDTLRPPANFSLIDVGTLNNNDSIGERSSVYDSGINTIRNKEFVKSLVDEIRHEIASEVITSPPKTVSGIAGTMKSINHNKDLPTGSNLTRYGSKIVGSKTYKAVDKSPDNQCAEPTGIKGGQDDSEHLRGLDRLRDFDTVWEQSASSGQKSTGPYLGDALRDNNASISTNKRANVELVAKPVIGVLDIKGLKLPSGSKNQKAAQRLEDMILGIT